MRKTVKKLLACCLVFALALTMVCGMGTISASAEAPAGTLTVGNAKINAATAGDVVVPITLATEHSVGFAAANFKVVIPDELQDKITNIAVVSDNVGNPALASYVDATQESIAIGGSFVAPTFGDDDTLTFFVEADDPSVACPKSITINITFTFAATTFPAVFTKLYDEFAITASIGEFDACDNGAADPDDFNIQYIDVTPVNGGLTVNYLIINAKNGRFESDYSLLIAVDKKWVDNFGAKLSVKKEGKAAYDVIPDATTETQTIKGAACYVLIIGEIPAKEVADGVTVTLKTDSYDGEVAEYNLVTYALSRISKTSNADEKKAMAAFLEYTSAAQDRFGYHTNNLADADLANENKNLTSVELKNEQSAINSEKPVYISNYNVSYEAKVELMAAVKFGANDISGYKVRYKYHGTSSYIYEEAMEGAEQQSINGTAAKVFRCNTIAVKDMIRVLDIEVVNGKGEIVDNTTYSFLTYAYNKQGKTDANVSKKMMAFAKAFAIYKGITVDF